jgi:Acetyltransferase (GNAT) family
MNVINIDSNDTRLLRQVLEIHDQMPLTWDPNHQGSDEHLNELVSRIQSNPDDHGFWTLSVEGLSGRDSIDGLLWASKRKDRLNVSFCSINSLWIHPEKRGREMVRLLTGPCLLWARAQGLERIEVSTHFQNARMREILETHLFLPEMIQYSLRL